MSSTNISYWAFSKTEGAVFSNIEKRIGDRMVPWGTSNRGNDTVDWVPYSLPLLPMR